MAVTRSCTSKHTLSASQNHKNIDKKKTKERKKKQSSIRTESVDTQQKQLSPPCSSPSKRNKSVEVRLMHGRIYDSEKGKTCHQCRQKTMDVTALCKNQSENMQCSFHFCHKCLLNRYGEKAEEVAALGDWKCPKCRGICNCSLCMKKRGCLPTGRLVHTAKATGFSSVAEMLHLEESKKVMKDEGASLQKRTASNEELGMVLTRKCGKENGFEEKSHLNLKTRPSTSNGDGEKHENPTMKKSRKKNGIGKDSKKIRKDEGASLKSATVSNKESAGRRGNEKGNGLDGKTDSKAQPKPLKTNGNEKETRNGKLKKTREADGIVNSLEGNSGDGVSMEKNRPKKRRIFKEAPKRNEKRYRMDNGGLLIKVKSEVHGPKKKYKGSIKTEDNNEIKMTNNAATKHKLNKVHKCKKNTGEVRRKASKVEIPLPQGIELTNVANIDMPAEDVGHALQFLEFCEAFGKVLDLKKGQPECLLRDLACGRSSRRRQDSSLVQFHVKLLTMIQKDSKKEYSSLKIEGRNSWLQALSKFISQSQYPSKGLLLDSFDVGTDGYEELNSSKRLKLLNFLCDEALGTVELRSWIDEQNSVSVEEEKKVKEKVLAEKEKEKSMQKNLQDEVARAIFMKNGAPVSISEQKDLISKIKTETSQNLAVTLEATGMVMKKKLQSDAVRAEPIISDANGRKFWKLRGYSGIMDILLQDVGSGDLVTFMERWFTYHVEEKANVEKYISSLRYAQIVEIIE
ncbi:hypothetical protein F0562_023821 [Nyssa sinensis]|uniref:DDT domain-containing protein n=1 Tax=Nyssa sinensis TaxID=561372 RepID=A0A5J5BKA1_9ASTE|nr:hypothetical protein F0562_023821 [Nyssa sinensis]